jgi:hypothetical protein
MYIYPISFHFNCLDKEKGHKTEEGAKFKHWAKNNFRKTTESLTGM